MPDRIIPIQTGCKLCLNVETQVREVVSDQHEVVDYNLNDANHPVEYYEAAKKYGLNSLPSVVVNGKLLSYCSQNKFDHDILLQAFL